MNPEAWNTLWTTDGRDADRNRGLLRRDVTNAKESLSSRATANLYVPGFSTEIRVTRGEYEAAIATALQRTLEELLDTITRANNDPTSVSAIYLTGGSSRTPAVTGLIADRLGRLPVTDGDPKAVVALGALQTPHSAVDETAKRQRDEQRPRGVRYGSRPSLGPLQTDVWPQELAAQITTAARAAGVADSVGVVPPPGPATDAFQHLSSALGTAFTAIAERYRPFPTITTDLSLRILREGAHDLGDLGHAITHLERIAAKLDQHQRQPR